MIRKHLQRAKILMEQSRYDLAEKELRKVLAQAPEHSEALGLIAYTYNRLELLDKAKDCANASLRIDPFNLHAFYTICEIAVRRNQKELLVKKIKQAQEIAPRDPHFFYLHAFFYSSSRQWQTALEIAKKGLSIAPNNQNLLNIHASALFYLKDSEGAKESLDYALRLNPWNHKSLETKGWLAMEAEDWGAAKQFFTDALRQRPNSADAKAGLVSVSKIKIPFYKYLIRWEIFTKRDQKKFALGTMGSIIGLIPVLLLLEWYEDTPYEFYILVLGGIIMLPLVVMGFLNIARSFTNVFLLKNEKAKHYLSKKEKESATGCIWVFGILIVYILFLAITLYNR